MVGAGKMRTIFELQHNNSSSQDSLGAPADNWRTIKRIYGKLSSISGVETMGGREIIAPGTVIITVWYDPDIRPVTSRLKIGSKLYDINNITDTDDLHAQMVITAKENQNQ